MPRAPEFPEFLSAANYLAILGVQVELDAVVAERCRRLDADTIRPHTAFHWWPKPVQPA